MLDQFFKKYAWTANLALIFAAAWLAARTVNTALGAVIRPRPTVDLTAIPAPPPRAPVAHASLDPDKLYYLIGQKPPPPPVAEGPANAPPPRPQNCSDRAATPVKSGLRAQLVAGVISDRPSQSIASITDLNTRDTRVYGVGDTVAGARIISVERLRDERDATGTGFKVAAILCNDGRKEYLDFEPGEGSAATPAATVAGAMTSLRAPGAPPAVEDEAAKSVRKVENNKYEVDRKYIDDTLSDLNKVATQARIVPSFKNGVANGFKLFSIQPNSLYSAIGVENGDVIQRINGFEINSPDKALEVYQKLRESPHITIEIERNGQIIRKEYNVTGS